MLNNKFRCFAYNAFIAIYTMTYHQCLFSVTKAQAPKSAKAMVRKHLLTAIHYKHIRHKVSRFRERINLEDVKALKHTETTSVA